MDIYLLSICAVDYVSIIFFRMPQMIPLFPTMTSFLEYFWTICFVCRKAIWDFLVAKIQAKQKNKHHIEKLHFSSSLFTLWRYSGDLTNFFPLFCKITFQMCFNLACESTCHVPAPFIVFLALLKRTKNKNRQKFYENATIHLC